MRVGPSDPRYHTLSMGFNQRWVGTPAYIQVVGSTAQVAETVREAVRAGLRVTVRGGGHCYEDFVSGNPGGVIIDMSQMHGVSRSADGTFWLEGGCTNWDVYTELYKRYDATLPGGPVIRSAWAGTWRGAAMACCPGSSASPWTT